MINVKWPMLLRRAKYCLHFYGSGGFSYVPRLPAWSFQRLICGRVLPPPHSPPAAELRLPPQISHEKNGGLPPVTSEKPHDPRIFDVPCKQFDAPSSKSLCMIHPLNSQYSPHQIGFNKIKRGDDAIGHLHASSHLDVIPEDGPSDLHLCFQMTALAHHNPLLELR